MTNENKLWVDEPCVVSFFQGEIGWLIQRWQGYLRYLKTDVYKDRKFVIMMNQQFHVLVHDFVNYTIDLPKEFYDLRLETDCFESPVPGSPPGSYTPPDVYVQLIEYFRSFYNKEKAIEVWPPRGADFFWIDHKQQIFTRYDRSKPPILSDKPILCICPRGRARASSRNIPEFVWKEVVDTLRNDFMVVLCGTPGGSSLVNYEGKSVLNLINYSGDDKFELCMEYMCNSICVVSSQSGLTHVGLMCNRPSYIIGHERERHAITENRIGAPVSFRYVPDYRLIDSKTIVEDLAKFLEELMNRGVITQFGTVEDTVDSIVYKDQLLLESIIKNR